MHSFTELPFELRRTIYSHLLEDDNPCYPLAVKPTISYLFDDRLRSRPRPVFCTSLFTVNKQVSAETLEYFYSQNLFVSVEDFMTDCRNCYFPLITLDNETTTTMPQIPSQNLALTIRMEGAGKIDRQFAPHGFCKEKIVFSGRHLAMFLVLMSHSPKWTGIPEPVDGIGITFTFNLKRGKYNFSLVPRNIDTIVDAIAMLRDFPKSTNLTGGIAYSIDGDILDNNRELAKELIDGFLSPFDRQVLCRDISFILREANARRDLGQLPQTVPVLYEGAEQMASRMDHVTHNSHALMDCGPYSLPKSEMLEVHLATLAGSAYQNVRDFYHAIGAFQRAVAKYKNLQHSAPSHDYFSVLYRICGQAFMAQFNAAQDGLVSHYFSSTANFSTSENLSKDSLEEALYHLLLAYQQSPDQGILQEMRECQRMLVKMEGDRLGRL